ncbi:MAG: hypothetical protein AXW15_03810 [Neptuniibacter sp. Phe_28]|jgi:hypothetical protein|nr:MAG: hypothetical protein AXW15_03810 [Neptuniibacter sp. Phe_28]
MTQIKQSLYFLLLLSLLTGCQSQATKAPPLAPAPLAVFAHETVWLTTSSANTAKSQQIKRFNLKLKDRLKMYGAHNIKTVNPANQPTDGLIIVSQINTDSDERTYQLSILRKNRELIRGTYPNTPEGDEVAISQFLMSIHQKIVTAGTYF